MTQVKTRAPGRICLFGDHQDYLGLPIIACAINRYITISGVENGQNYFEFHLPDLGRDRFRESVHNPKNKSHLTNTITVVKRYGCIPNKGYDITISGDIPINAGLSSSSAVVVAWTQWLLFTFGCSKEITPQGIAQIAYEAEVVEQNSPGGKMDQYTSALGDILYLETDENAYHKNLGTTLSGLIIGASGIPKDTIGLLGDLRGNTLKAIEKVKSKFPDFNLPKATLTHYEAYKNVLSKEEEPFFYASIQNHLITQKSLIELSKEQLDYSRIGALMNAHHSVLKDSLKITVPRIDAMIQAALKAGAYGAKIVGSGGGGSVCILAPDQKQEEIVDALKNAGAVAAYPVNVSKGVHIL